METAITRLGWAREHIDRLDGEIGAFFAKNPHDVVAHFDRDSLTYTYRLEVKLTPPSQLGLIAGDAIHNMRACIDNLMWTMARRRRIGRKLLERIDFPIATEEKRFSSFRRRYLRRFSKKAIAALDTLQPYHAPNPDRHPLAILRKLSNYDKHRQPTLLIAQTRQTLFLGNGHITNQHVRYGRMEDGKVVASVTVAAYPHPELHASFAFDVALEEPGGGPRYRGVVDALSEIQCLIADKAFPALRPFV